MFIENHIFLRGLLLRYVLAAHAPGYALLQPFMRWSGIAVDDLIEIDPFTDLRLPCALHFEFLPKQQIHTRRAGEVKIKHVFGILVAAEPQ